MHMKPFAMLRERNEERDERAMCEEGETMK